jgi:hypothetical protein
MADPEALVREKLGQESTGSLAAVLDQVHAACTRFVVYPSLEHADAVTLYIAATHAQDVWEHATRILLTSPVRRCGKTRTLEVMRELAHNVIVAANASVAVLVHSIDESDPPTIILDEADTIFATRRGERSESAEDLRGILNAGHSRGWPYLRWDVKRREREECATFAMAALGAIGDLPDTIEDRGIKIPMRRRAAGEPVQGWRRRRVVPQLRALRERLHKSVRAHVGELLEAEPDLPVEDRAADVWEPLVALADAAGGEWPDRARRACLVLSGEAEPDEATAGERLLADLQAVWGDEAHIPTADLLPRLHALEESPWGNWYGHELTARDLARLLRPYRIRSRTVRLGEATPKGYAWADLRDAWARYTRTADTSATLATDAKIGPTSSENGRGGRVADKGSSFRNEPDQPEPAPVAAVADVAEGRDETGDPELPAGVALIDGRPCVRCLRYGPDHIGTHIPAWEGVG